MEIETKAKLMEISHFMRMKSEGALMTVNGLSEHTEGREIIQRYCPRIGENVLMVRNLGPEGKPRCLYRETCKAVKDGKCHSGEKN